MPLQIGREFLFLSKSTLISLLLKTSGVSKSQNFIKPQLKTQEFFSVKWPQGQVFHAKQNPNRQNYLYKLGKSKRDSGGILFSQLFLTYSFEK